MAITVDEYKMAVWKRNEKGQNEFTRYFQIVSDTLIGPWTAAAAIGINIGDQYITDLEFDLLAFCKGAQTDASERVGQTGIKFYVSVDYGGIEYAPPEQRPPQYSWSCGQFEKENIEHDIDGELITNTVGDIMRTKKDDPRPTLSITTWHGTPNFNLAYLYRNAVNQDTFFGSQQGTAKISDIKYDSEEFEDTTIWKFQRQISFNPEGWKDQLVNAGLNELKDGKKTPILVKGQPVSEPVALTEDGEVLPDGDPPHIIEVQHYPELPFSIFDV